MLVGSHTLINFSHLEGVSVPAKQLKDPVSVDGETGPCPEAALDVSPQSLLESAHQNSGKVMGAE